MFHPILALTQVLFIFDSSTYQTPKNLEAEINKKLTLLEQLAQDSGQVLQVKDVRPIIDKTHNRYLNAFVLYEMTDKTIN
jgi:hypothetical protein